MITINNLSKKFHGKSVVENFSLEVKDSDYIIITGESGAGKSTLLNIIGALEKYDSGEVLFDGKELRTISKRTFYRNKVAFLFQNFALIENKTVKRNLEIIPKKDRNQISINEALSRVGLLDKLNEKVYSLSGGEQQRVALARVILKKCDYILADEPTGSLDENNARMVMNILDELHKEGKTIIVVTHSKDMIARGNKHVVIKKV